MEIVANSARDSDGVDFQGGKHEDAEWITSVPRERKHCAAILRHVGLILDSFWTHFELILDSF